MSELIPVATPYIIEEDAKAVYDCVLSTWISMGKCVETFENQFAEYVGSKFAIAMNNGTSTLHASLAALGIGPGDEVIVPTLTYISTVNVILFQGAKPILCESNPKTYNMDVGNVQKLVTKNTKAVITVDMNGLPIDYDQWKKFSDEYKIPIIADSAESCGAIYKNNYVGSQLFAHSFSFFPNKNLTTGEGGMVTTNDKEFAKTLRILRNQGQDYRYNHIKLGYNYRMTDIQAALGKVQLGRMEWVAKKKEKIKNFYNQYFLECDGVTTPFVPDYVSRPSWYMYTISLNKSIDRDKVKDRLKKKGIGTRRSFPPVHIQPYHSKILATNFDDFPISHGAWKQLLNLPVGITLTDNQLLKVVNAVKASI